MGFTRVPHDQYFLTFVRNVLENVYVGNSWNKSCFCRTMSSYVIQYPTEINASHKHNGVSCGTTANHIDLFQKKKKIN